MSFEGDLVSLRDGPTVPLAALRFLWDLEARGFTVRQDGAVVVVNPGSLLTDGDKTFIRENRSALLALIAYVDHVEQ